MSLFNDGYSRNASYALNLIPVFSSYFDMYIKYIPAYALQIKCLLLYCGVSELEQS